MLNFAQIGFVIAQPTSVMLGTLSKISKIYTFPDLHLNPSFHHSIIFTPLNKELLNTHILRESEDHNNGTFQ